MSDLALSQLLRQVMKPAQYINNEAGAIHKDLSKVSLSCCLCYPDKYEIGMSNLGLEILYFRGNSLPQVAVERAYLPEADLEKLLREKNLPVWGLESRRALHQFDLVGVTLQHELTYTNVLLLLELGKIPLKVADRTDKDPLVFAGGPCAYNPEPLADFLDLVLIGEGEEIFEFVLNELSKPEIKKLSRAAKLKHLVDTGRDGIYVPSLHNTTKKHFVKNLKELDTHRQSIIPYIDTIHNRSAVEILRGCLHGCRFCQAGFTWRPLRGKSKDQILREVDSALTNTGHDEISLLSLTASDHPEIEEIVVDLNQKYAQKNINISLPSIRSETVSDRLLQEIQKVRKSTITIAPEAGTQRLRDAIHKEMTEEDILKAAEIAIRCGTRSLKLYFIIGLPTETDADLIAIPQLAEKILHLSGNKQLNVTISASIFVPKPHTPFQWAGVIDEAESKRRQSVIKQNLRSRRITFRYHDASTSVLEALLSRGGREMGKVILTAFQNGCRFDAWHEHFKYETWLAAFAEHGFTVPELLAPISIEKDLPWDHIKVGVPKGYLKKEYLASGAQV